MAELSGIGLIKHKKNVCKENPQLSERQKTVARYWNTAQRERVQFVDKDWDLIEDHNLERKGGHWLTVMKCSIPDTQHKSILIIY